MSGNIHFFLWRHSQYGKGNVYKVFKNEYVFDISKNINKKKYSVVAAVVNVSE